MTPVFVSGQWVWPLETGGFKPLTPHEVEDLKKGVFHDE